jgi:hypothetical protein
MTDRVATAVWRVSPALVLALDERLGTPVDSYVNGSQTWLLANGPAEVLLEWRLHPVAGYRTPKGVSHYDVFEAVVAALSSGADPGALVLGAETKPLTGLWDGLECFAAYGDDVEPQPLAAAATDALGIAPDAAGLVDHQAIGDEWERARGNVSIVALLLRALNQPA